MYLILNNMLYTFNMYVLLRLVGTNLKTVGNGQGTHIFKEEATLTTAQIFHICV